MSNYKVYKSGNLRGEKITYKDGTGCCIWTPFKKNKEPDINEDEEPGICFDFSATDLKDLANLANILESAKADIYIPDIEAEEFEKKWKEKETKWWYKILTWLGDIHIGISPFEWRFTTFMVSRPTNATNTRMLVYQWCKGFIFGPLRVTWH